MANKKERRPHNNPEQPGPRQEKKRPKRKDGNKPRKEKPKPAEKPKPKFGLAAGFLAATSVAAFATLYEKDPPHQMPRVDITHDDSTKRKESEKKPIIRVNYDVPEKFGTANQKAISNLFFQTENAVNSILETMRRDSRPLPPIVEATHTMKSIEKKNVFSDDPEREGELASQQMEMINDATAFWDHPKLSKPDVSFETPQSDADRKTRFGAFPRDRRVVIQMLDHQQITYNGEVSIEGVSDLIARTNTSYTDSQEGSANRKVTFDNVDGNIHISVQREPVIWNIGGKKDSDLALLETPAIETLHTQLSQGSLELLSAGISEMQSQVTRKELTVLLNKFMALEEAVVHTIAKIWFDSYMKKNGRIITDEEEVLFWKRAHVGVRELYDSIPTKDKKTVNQIISDYFDDPNKLAKQAGLLE